MAATSKISKILDKGRNLQLINKSIEGRKGGARIWTRAPQLTHHFLDGSTLPVALVATDTNTGTAFAPSTGTAAVQGGAAVGVSHAADGSSELGHRGNWFRPSMGANSRIVMEARLRCVNSVSGTRGEFVVGWADNSAFSGGLPYVFATNGTLSTKVPTNAAVFMVSDVPTGTVTGAASYPHQLVTITSLAATGTVTAANATRVFDLGATGSTYGGATYNTYRVEIDANGTAFFFLDDVFMGQSATGAVSTSGSLTPYIQAGSVTGTMTTTVDYIFAGGEVV